MDLSFTSYRDSTAKSQRRTSSSSKSANKTTKKHKHKIKKSGVRTKFLIESLRQEYYQQREENEWLRDLVMKHLPQHKAQELLASCYDPNTAPKNQPSSNKELDELAAKMMPGLTMTGGNPRDGSDDEDDDMSDNDAVGF